MALYLHRLHEIARVGADVMWVKCEQDSCMPMLYVMSSSDPSTGLSWLSQRLGIGVKNYTGSTWVRTGNTVRREDARGSSQGNHFFHQNTSQRSDLHTLVLKLN